MRDHTPTCACWACIATRIGNEDTEATLTIEGFAPVKVRLRRQPDGSWANTEEISLKAIKSFTMPIVDE